ncbi:MAG: CatA-like O-acetyltransferase [Clostridia bacterium]
MKEIDIDTWNRKTQYEWFNSFLQPCFSINSEIDVTNLLKVCKDNKKSFFIAFMYIISQVSNKNEAFLYRLLENKVVKFPKVSPSFVILNDTEQLTTQIVEFSENFNEFYEIAEKEIHKRKKEICESKQFNSPRLDLLFISTIPWISVTSITHPLPLQDKSSLSIPRILWDKYTQRNDKFFINLNVNVHHALMDGKEVCDFFVEVQYALEHLAKKIIAEGEKS